MIKYTMDVIRNAVQHLNGGQTPVVTFDQLLFALAKQIQWKWLQEYGEQKFVVVFGGLHIEMAALKTLQGSGWVQALVQAEITSAGTADSSCRHPMSVERGGHIRSQQQHCRHCSGGPTTTTLS